ncbi:Calmodulin-like protein 11 [Phytophthora citrophthora]|uniref:Calmodulin-like protein 11 n=1 Tax=Phytophthora citrophthora TaxID=4793 RepID=A0AAD9GL39_9STRA|nr:Calmodulin-like protein 11 [Phytophthora citrophthora]
MEGPPVGSLALSGAGYALDKSRSSHPTRPAGRTPRSLPGDTASGDPILATKITSVDALIKELRKAVHAMFCTVDPSISTSSAYENYSRQAFRFFTTTNTITPECFQHKVVRLRIQAAPRLCNELFSRIDQEDIGEIDYPTFAQRIFLPETFFSPDDEPSPTPAVVSPVKAPPRRTKSPRLPAAVSSGASGSSSKNSQPAYEYMALDELERCIARRLEEKIPRGTADPVAQAFRCFTNSDAITFADFHRHLGMLQIQLSPPKCRELFVRFDKDRDGVIDSIEFATTILARDRPMSARSVRTDRSSVSQEASLSTKQLVAMLRERMDQLSEETDRFQQAFMLFGKPVGISHSDLSAAMRRLGLKISEKQLQDLFDTFDFDKTGDLDVNKFVQGVMLDDNSTSFWLSVKDRQKVDDSRRKLYSMAVQSVQESWTIADIERMLREKIEQRTSKSSDCFRQAFKIFKKVNGIKPHEFHAALEAIGLALTRVQSDILFRRFDKDGSGDIDLNEFIHGVLPPDYTGISWVAAADELHRIEAKNKKEHAMANPDQYMTEIEMESWSLDEIEMRIRDKIQQSTSRSSDTFRQAYKIFKKASHVTMDEFRERLLALGFRLTPAQCLGLFKRYDTDNSNDLDLQEFCNKILPPDYTHDGDHWSHSEKYRKERQRMKLEYVKRSKNGLIMLPKFIESHRFTRGRYFSRTFEEMQQNEAPSFGIRSDRSSECGETRPSTSSSTGEASRPTTPRPPSVCRPPSTVSVESNNSPKHLPSPRQSNNRPAPLSSPLASASPRHLRTAALSPKDQIRATPPTSPHVVSPNRPMSPRTPVSTPRTPVSTPRTPVSTPRTPVSTPRSPHNNSHPMTPRSPHNNSRPATPRSPHNNSRPATPHKPSPRAEDVEIEYEDEEILDDDEVASLDLARAKHLTRHRRKHGKGGRRHDSDRFSTTSSQVSVRLAESVCGSSTSTSSGGVGTAKHMPQRNHVLLIKRYMQATAKGSEPGSSKNTKRLGSARR